MVKVQRVSQTSRLHITALGDLMSTDNPTLSEIGEQNIRERAEKYGEPVDYYLNYLDNEYERGE